ncbi:MAG: SAM-dependent chlorinase/fluorinase [Thermoanaerobaculia bacterium]
MSLLTLLTDFGLDDYFVAAVKGTVLRLAPGVAVIDISHGVPAGDVPTAAFLLGAAWSAFPRGAVHLAIVDPGVGSERRILAAELDGSFFVAPDNGLLTPILEGSSVRQVTRRELFLDGPSETFHGRDRFAPVAAHLLRGEPFQELGPTIADPLKLDLERPSREDGEIRGSVVHIDRFGNLVTNIPSGWLPGRPFEAQIDGRSVTAFATHYDQLVTGQPGILPGSVGTLEISLRGADLAARWGIRRGADVRILMS